MVPYLLHSVPSLASQGPARRSRGRTERVGCKSGDRILQRAHMRLAQGNRFNLSSRLLEKRSSFSLARSCLIPYLSAALREAVGRAEQCIGRCTPRRR